MAQQHPTILRPQAGPQTEFLRNPADIILYGGAAGGGKTFAQLLECTRHLNERNFRAVIFRRIEREIRNAGGLWDESLELFLPLGGFPNKSSLSWHFPSGASVRFAHLQHEHHKYQWKGAQIPLLMFDEVDECTETQVFYLLSRNRSKHGFRPYSRWSCNASARSWLAKFIQWYWDEKTGLPIEERGGKIRYFARVEETVHWGDTKQELFDRFPHLEPYVELWPLSFTFIPAKLDDNKLLTEADPEYRAKLLSLTYVERQRLLHGNWKVSEVEGAIWGDEFWTELYSAPWPDHFEASVMAIDPSKGGPNSDYAAIVFVGLSGNHFFVDAVVDRLPPAKLASAVVDMFTEHRPLSVAIEENMLQDIAFVPLIQQETEARGVPPIPISGLLNRTKKRDRISRLGPYVQARQFRFRRDSPGCDMLESQFRGFPNPDIHDDGPDAVEMAVRKMWDLASAVEGD